MLWRGQRQSDNVEDRRGMGGGGLAIGGGLGGIVLLVIALLLGADPRQLLQQSPGEAPSAGTQNSRPLNPQEEELKQFSATVLASTEDVWDDLFRQQGAAYRKPSSFCLPKRSVPVAAKQVWLSVPSTVPVTRNFTSTFHSSMNCKRDFARPEILPRLT